MTERILYDICSGFSLQVPSFCRHYFHHHTLAYLYDGCMILRNQCGETLNIRRGECAYIGRDSYLSIYAQPDENGKCRVAFFSLPRSFLCEFYQTMDNSGGIYDGETLSTLHQISNRPDVESLFRSLAPYFLSGQALPKETARLKMAESTYLLLNCDHKYSATLFDFTSTCRMDVLDLFMNQTDKDFYWKELRKYAIV